MTRLAYRESLAYARGELCTCWCDIRAWGGGFGIVLRHALAVGVHEPELVLCVGIALLGCLPKPSHRLSIVLWHSLTINIYSSKMELRQSISLLGSTAIPLCRFGIILWHSAGASHPGDADPSSRPPGAAQ